MLRLRSADLKSSSKEGGRVLLTINPSAANLTIKLDHLMLFITLLMTSVVKKKTIKQSVPA